MTESTIYNHWAWRNCEYIFTNHELMNQLISHKAVCRTAPATLGLLNVGPELL